MTSIKIHVSFDSILEIFGTKLVAPVMESLANHRADCGIVKLGSSLVDLVDEVVSKSAFWSGEIQPSLHLTRIVI